MGGAGRAIWLCAALPSRKEAGCARSRDAGCVMAGCRTSRIGRSPTLKFALCSAGAWAAAKSGCCLSTDGKPEGGGRTAAAARRSADAAAAAVGLWLIGMPDPAGRAVPDAADEDAVEAAPRRREGAIGKAGAAAASAFIGEQSAPSQCGAAAGTTTAIVGAAGEEASSPAPLTLASTLLMPAPVPVAEPEAEAGKPALALTADT